MSDIFSVMMDPYEDPPPEQPTSSAAIRALYKEVATLEEHVKTLPTGDLRNTALAKHTELMMLIDKIEQAEAKCV